MGAVKRAVARAQSETAMGQMPAGDLVVRLELGRKRIPALSQNTRFLLVNRIPEGVPARAPARSAGRGRLWRRGE